MKQLRIGLALTGSYCTYDKALAALEELAKRHDVTALMSESAYWTDTRFGDAADFVLRLGQLTGKPVLHSIPEAEPIGPRDMFDVLAVAPCTGNTAAKLAAGITDTAVTMAVKSHLRNGRPVVLAFGSNDGLSASAKNTLRAARIFAMSDSGVRITSGSTGHSAARGSISRQSVPYMCCGSTVDRNVGSCARMSARRVRWKATSLASDSNV